MKIRLDQIKIAHKDPNMVRVRKDFGNIPRLAESIKTHGLINPIVVIAVADDYLLPGEPLEYLLLAGERRLRAVMFLEWTEIEATLRDDLDDSSRKELELEENISRKDLSWQEEARLIAQIDTLKRRLHGSATKGTVSEGWGLQQTADAIGASIGKVSQDLALARALDDNEIAMRVMHLPRQAAVKVVRQIQRAKTLKQSVERHEIEVSSDLRLGNCVDLIKELPSESIHLLLTDPPFSAACIQAVGATSAYGERPTNVSDDATMIKVFGQLIPELWRVLVPGAHFYMFFGMHLYDYMVSSLRSAGFMVDNMPLIWDKLRVSIGAKDMHYMSSYEPILYGWKQGEPRRLLWKPVPNVLKIQALPPQSRIHSLQKPPALLQLLIENSTSIGETVLDTFAGSGATIAEARNLQRSAIGFEIDEQNYLQAQEFLGRSSKNA